MPAKPHHMQTITNRKSPNALFRDPTDLVSSPYFVASLLCTYVPVPFRPYRSRDDTHADGHSLQPKPSSGAFSIIVNLRIPAPTPTVHRHLGCLRSCSPPSSLAGLRPRCGWPAPLLSRPSATTTHYDTSTIALLATLCTALPIIHCLLPALPGATPL
jgi:hypothetical protein